MITLLLVHSKYLWRTSFLSSVCIWSVGSQLEHVNSFKYLGLIIISNNHGFLTSNLSALKLVKPLGSSTVTSISMLLKLFSLALFRSLVIPYFTYCSYVWDPPVFFTNSETLEKLNTLLYKCTLINKTTITHLFSQLLTFRPSQLVNLFLN